VFQNSLAKPLTKHRVKRNDVTNFFAGDSVEVVHHALSNLVKAISVAPVSNDSMMATFRSLPERDEFDKFI